MLDFSWRWSILVIITHSVAIRRTLFLDICNIRYYVSPKSDVQIGAVQYVCSDDVFLVYPHIAPLVPFGPCFSSSWSRLSKVIMISSTLTFSVLFTSFVHVVKRETDYLEADRWSFLFRKKSTKDLFQGLYRHRFHLCLRPKQRRYSHLHKVSKGCLVVILELI